MKFEYEPTEKEFQKQVTDAARTCGFQAIYHTYRSSKSPAGFPDLVAVHPTRGVIVFAELKRNRKARVSPEQKRWLAVLEKAAESNPGVYVRLWTPEDWTDVLTVLTGRRQEAA